MEYNKYIGLFFLVLFLKPEVSFGQESYETPLISRYKPGIGWFFNGTKPPKEKKIRKYDRLIVDIVYNDWHGDVDLFKSPWTSIGFNTQLMFDKVISDENTFALGWGLGFSHVNNRTPWIYIKDLAENRTIVIDDQSAFENIKRSKLSANYIELPLELRFRTKGYKHFKFMVGGKVGYQLNAYSKIVESIGGQNYSVKSYNFPDNNPLRLGATVRIGIRNWAIFGAYHFTRFFTHPESVQLTPYSVGVSISLF